MSIQERAEQAASGLRSPTRVSVETLEAACQRITYLEDLLGKCAHALQEHAEYNAGKPNIEMRLLILIDEATR